MSDFDKYVAQWVSRAGDNLSKEAREQLLTNIHDSLGDYEALRDPTAARARKEAVEKGKQREEAQKAQEEQTRKRQERQANLPPLPPSKSNADMQSGAPAAVAASASDAGKPKKKKAAKKSGTPNAAASAASEPTACEGGAAELGDTVSSRKSRTSQKIPYSKEGAARATKRHQAGTVQVRDIDFKFGERVDAQLRSLEAEKSTKAASAGKKKVKVSSVVDVVDPVPAADADATPAAEASVAAAESSEDMDGAATAAATAAAQKAARKRSSPPPLDQVVEEVEKARQQQEESQKKPEQDEEQKTEEEDAAARAATAYFTPTNHVVGPADNHSGSASDDDSAASFGETKNFQDRLNTFHFASLGEDRNGDADADDRSDVADEEEEYIDDREDARRRTMQMSRPSRPAISDSTLDIDEARIANFPTTPKSQNKVKTISRVLVRHFLFSTLDDSDIARFASIMDLEKFEAGEKLLAEGELNDTFYIILDGEAETTELNDAGESVTVPLVTGNTCGDLALMYEVKNEVDVVARTSLQCASLERRTYKMITSRAMEDKRTKYIGFLGSLPLFAGLSPYQLECIAESLKEDTYVAGQRVITYGVPNHWLHIIVEGTLRVVYTDEDGQEREVAVMHRGQLAGEIEFIYHHLPVASVYAESAVVKTAKLSRRSFELVPSQVRERLVSLVEDDAHYASYHSRVRSASPPAFDMTPPFDAPSASVQKSLRQRESDQSEGSPAASATPPPPSE